MTELNAKIRRVEGKTIAALGYSNHWVMIDEGKESGGNDAAPRPMELLLFGVGGCALETVISLLEKMRVEPGDIDVKVSAIRRDEVPKSYEKISIEFRVKGRGIDKEKVEKAVRLAEEKYCSAIATIRKGAVVESKVSISEA
jgi:putative redox protein